ncbi:MAG: AsmA family protein [Pseudomonadales bacterium]|nr:AsmA family protein [Pseudomonadales bacterium]MCP5344711.1 AsmA family protein [Pseudomonadales bacterium]
MKLIKLLLLSLISLALMAVLALVLAFTLIDPARYKSTIESVFARQSGLQLQIAGDIDWAFNPVFGLSLSDLRLRNPDSPMELASLASITIRIEPRALLDGRLQMQEFIANDLHINWIVNAEGVSNWPTAQAGQSDNASNRTAPATDTAISAEIAQITVNNASLSIQDAPRGINTSFERLHFSSQNSNLENRAFPFELSFVVTDNIADQNATVSISSQASVDLARGNARLEDLQIKLNPLQLQGQLVLNDFRNALSWSSELRSNTFALSDFLALYVRAAQDETAPLGDYSNSEDQFSLSLSAMGNAQAITLNSLHLALDAMRLDANASYTAAMPGGRANLRYELSANALDLNRYTQASDAQAVALSQDSPPIDTEDATPTAATSSDTELPIELLQSMNIQGVHRIDSLAIGGLQLGAINANLNVQDGLLNFDLRPVPFYEGQISTTVNYDTRPNPASLTSISSVRNVNVAGLASALPMTRFATGRLNVESVHTLYGRTVNQLLDSISGTTSFSLDDNSIDISIVKQLFSSISVLSPAGTGDAAQQWPDNVRFSSLAGHLILNQGLDENQQFKVTLDNVEIAANGGVERDNSRFHYDATLTVFGEPAPQTIAVAPLYQGVGWPVICEGSFSAAPSEFCGPDFSRVRDLFEQIARDAVQRRAQEAIQERVPEELQDAARSLLDRFRR